MSETAGLVARFGSRAQIAVLAALALVFLAWPVWRVPFPIEIASNEAWNAAHADAALHGALYASRDSLVANNYPPLSYYALGYAQTVFGDALYLGRVLSLVATAGLGLLIATIVRQLGAGAAAGAIAGIWFVATMARFYSRFVGMNDPQLAGHFLMMAALAWFLARDRDGKSAEPPILLMVVAGFWKHNIIAVPATVLLWLLLRDGRRAIRPIAVGLGAAAAGLAICAAVYGEAFFAHLLTEREYSPMRIVKMLGRPQWIYPALAIWALWAWSERGRPAARFTALYVGIAFAAFLLQSPGEGVLDNAHFDLVIATAIGLGIAYDRAGATAFAQRFGVDTARAAIGVILVIRLLASLRIEPFLIVFDSVYRAEFHLHADVARSEARRVAAVPGKVACSVAIVCRMAGKAFVYDEFRVETLLAKAGTTGLTEADLLRRYQISYVGIDTRAHIDSLQRTLTGRP
jgi:hypothetical protein